VQARFEIVIDIHNFLYEIRLFSEVWISADKDKDKGLQCIVVNQTLKRHSL